MQGGTRQPGRSQAPGSRTIRIRSPTRSPCEDVCTRHRGLTIDSALVPAETFYPGAMEKSALRLLADRSRDSPCGIPGGRMRGHEPPSVPSMVVASGDANYHPPGKGRQATGIREGLGMVARLLLCGVVGVTAALAVWAVASCSRKRPDLQDAHEWSLGAPEEWSLADVNTAGEGVMARSLAAYANLRSYVGRASVFDELDYPKGQNRSSLSARITYSRPGRVRIEGVDSSGDPFTIISDGTTIWRSWVGTDQRFVRERSLAHVFSAMHGTTRGVLIALPSSLLGITWTDEKTPPWIRGRFLAAYGKGATLTGEEEVDGHLCYRVVSERPAETWIFWVDKVSHLLRKAQRRVSREQQKKYWGGACGEASYRALRRRASRSNP